MGLDPQAPLTGAAAQLVLASASPRRAELLARLGLRFVVQAQNIPEHTQVGETAQAYVQRVARAKAQAGWQASRASYGLPVLGADTEVIVDGRVLGKPAGRDEGLAMLSCLSGRQHQVCSAVAVVADGQCQMRTAITQLQFAPLSAGQIQRYWETGEPLGKAGGYAIQGRAAAFVEHLSGSYSGVVGLPLFETAALLRQVGITL